MDMLFENADFQNDIFLREHQTALKNLHNCLTIVSISNELCPRVRI